MPNRQGDALFINLHRLTRSDGLTSRQLISQNSCPSSCALLCATFCAPAPMCYMLFTLPSRLFITPWCISEGINVTNLAAGSSPCKMLLTRCLELLDFKVHIFPAQKHV